MWTTILSLVLGAVPGVIKGLAQARVDLANAETEHEKVEASERLKTLEIQRDALVKEAQTPWATVARFALLAPFVFYWWWILAWDKIACKWFTEEDMVRTFCNTDDLGPYIWAVAGGMVGFYFLTSPKIWKR